MTATEMLDHLADMQEQVDRIQVHFWDLRGEIIPPEIQMQLIELDAERDTAMEPALKEIANLEADIKANILEAGVSAKGSRLHAIWSKGRVSWDTKALDGYVAAHSELLPFRKEGNPTVSIRAIKE